jgi:hypothetical protein
MSTRRTLVTIVEASTILRGMPLDAAVAVSRELDRLRPLEAHRILTLHLGDARRAKEVTAALIKWRLLGR